MSQLRSGTENVPGIAAFGAVCNEIDIDKNFCKVKELNSELRRINGQKSYHPKMHHHIYYVLLLKA